MSMVIPNSVTEMGNSVFNGCSNLRSVSISNSLTSIPSNCFENCIRLENVDIPNSVEAIWFYAFSGCRNLSSVTFPKSVRQISGYAFYDCSSLTDVTCLATTPPMAWEESFDNYDMVTLHVPASSIEQYKTTTPWKEFYSILPIDIQPEDVNGDNEINIADINAVINIILTDSASSSGDVNRDGEVNIADVNKVIVTILSR